MVSRKWIDTGFDIGEVLPEESGHIRIETSAIWNGRIGVGAPTPRLCHSDGRAAFASRRMTTPCPIYQATRGNCVARYAARRTIRESGLVVRLFQRQQSSIWRSDYPGALYGAPIIRVQPTPRASTRLRDRRGTTGTA